MRALLRRVVALVNRSRSAEDLSEEIETHRLLRQAQLERDGLSAMAAERASRRALGNITLAREDVRAMWVVRLLEELWQDVRIGWRMLRKHPGVTSVAVLSLALGLGINAAALSVVRAILFDALPYPHSDRLVMVWSVNPSRPDLRDRATGPEYLAWQSHATMFETMGTEGQMVWELGASDDGAIPAERARIQRLTSSMFDLLGVRPTIGRGFRPEEEPVGAPAPIALLSDDLWERRFARDPGVVGRVITLNGTSTTVVGVMPRRFSFLSDGQIDLFVPFAFSVAQTRGSGRGYAPLARLKDGITIEQAQAQLSAIAAQVASELPPSSRGWTPMIQPLHEALYGPYRPSVLSLAGVTTIVLVVACVNLAGVLIAAGRTRTTEMAVRASIGAGRARLVRQLLTESALLSLVGGAAGVAVAWVALRALLVNSIFWLPQMRPIDLSGHILTSTLALAILTGLLAGVLPAIRGSQGDLTGALKASGKGRLKGAAPHRLGHALVITQIALGVVLLVGAGLLIRSYQQLQANQLGADQRGVLIFGMSFPTNRFQKAVGSHAGFPLSEISPRVALTIQQTVDAMSTLPGVESAAGVNHVPFSSSVPNTPFRLAGAEPTGDGDGNGDGFNAGVEIVTHGFVRTMNGTIVRGRDFASSDSATSPWVVVINESMAKRFWPGDDALGKSLTFMTVDDERAREVVGIVRDIRQSPYETTSRPIVYSLYNQQAAHQLCRPACGQERLGMQFIVRAGARAASVATEIRRAMTALDRDRPITEIRLLERDVAGILAWSRWTMTSLAVLAAIATFLAAIGLYGVLSHGITERTHEIGLRMALGASRRSVWALVLRQVALDVAVGLGVGVGLAIVLSRMSVSQLWGVTPTDPATYVGVATLMTMVACMASVVPVRRAVRVMPNVALKAD